MDTDDKEKFRKNYIWFNQFFGDLRQLMTAISKRLASEFGLAKSDKSWYYEKPDYQPRIPPYYLTALGGTASVVQIFAVLDETLLEEQRAFKHEPSLIVVKHSRTNRVLYSADYGLRIIGNKGITQAQTNEKVIAGDFRAGDGKGAKYFAFQATLDHFAAGNDIDAAIRTEIIDVLRDLPDWEVN